MDSLVTRWGRGAERERQACTTACSCSQRNVTCSWSACNCKFVRRRREAVERGGVRRWRRKRGQPGVSALTSATPRFFCHRSVPLHLHTAPQCTPRRLPWLVFHPRVPSPVPLEPVPKRKRFYLLARSKPPVFVDRTRRQPVFMTVLIRLITAPRCLGIGRRLIITKI